MSYYENLFKKSYFFEDKDHQKHFLQCGFIKKKQDQKSLTNLFGGSTKKFFCFHLRGQLLCYYDSFPVGEHPSLVPKITEESRQLPCEHHRRAGHPGHRRRVPKQNLALSDQAGGLPGALEVRQLRREE